MPARGPNLVYPVLLQYLIGVEVGGVVTWQEIERVCGRDMKHSGRSTLAKAKEELEREHGKKLSLPEARGFVMLDAGTDTTERMRDLSPCYVERVERTEEGDALQDVS